MVMCEQQVLCITVTMPNTLAPERIKLLPVPQTPDALLHALLLQFQTYKAETTTRIEECKHTIATLTSNEAANKKKIEQLEKSNADLLAFKVATEQDQMKKEAAAQKQKVEEIAPLINRVTQIEKWKLESKLIRKSIVLPQMNHLQKHNEQCTIVEDINFIFPAHTMYILVGVYLFHGNNAGENHANLCGKLYQQGNPTQCATLQNYSYYNYACSTYYELQVPWDSAFANALVFDITESSCDGHLQQQPQMGMKAKNVSLNENMYRISVEGYQVCELK